MDTLKFADVIIADFPGVTRGKGGQRCFVYVFYA